MSPADNSSAPASQQVVDLSRPGGNEIDPLAIIEQRNQLLDRVLDAAIRATHPGQWKDLGGNPWPEGPACEAMARRCAVSMTGISREKIQTSDDRGPFYIWVYRATFSLPGGRDVIEAEGTCSSRDSFLGTETSAGRPLSDCDEGSIMKAALTNCRVNGICQLLGVRRMSWERLGELGLNRDAVGKVEYDQGAKGGGRGKPSDDIDLKFGRGKGKKLSEVSDGDVHYYVGIWKEDLGNPEKSKFHGNCKRNIEIAQRLLATRANAKAGHVASAGAQTPSIWQRILALPEAKGVGEQDLKAFVRDATGKANASQLTEEDLVKVKEGLAGPDADIPF